MKEYKTLTWKARTNTAFKWLKSSPGHSSIQARNKNALRAHQKSRVTDNQRFFGGFFVVE